MAYDLSAVAEKLTDHGFKVLIFPRKEDVVQWLKNDFAAVETVGRGGSETLESLGFDEIIKSRGMQLFNHAYAKPEEKRKIWGLANSSEAYFLSANAVTADGMIFNVDGAGNRVSAMSFGPKKVYYIVGRNKIVDDLNKAHERLQTIAAPKNVARLSLPTGCAKTGRCMDCSSSKRICNSYTVLARAPWAVEESWVLLVDEDMGY
ncbi:MAG: lactate utilization protein [Bacillota bacterium]|jgi:hypothetical protein